MRPLSVLAVLVALLAACAAPVPSPTATPSPPLVVFADRALANVLRDIRTAFAQAHPEITTELVLEDSAEMRDRIKSTAQPGILMSADTTLVAELQKGNRLEDPPRPVARDPLVLFAARANPADVERVEDLNRPDLRIAIAQDNTPLGTLTGVLVDNLEHDATFGPDFPALLKQNVRVQAADAQAILQSVIEGRADVGIVQASEAELWKERITVYEFDPGLRAAETFTVVKVRTASDFGSAQLFFYFLFSPQAETLWQDDGYELPK